MAIAFLISLPLIFIIGLIVFGGGQVFIPLFIQLWQFLTKEYQVNISDETIDVVVAIVNSTPGVVSTKLATFSGLLVANGMWWGWLALFGTYLIFILPACLMMIIANRMLVKIQNNKYLESVIVYLQPIVSGILIALAIQLFIGIVAPTLQFNTSTNEYIKFNPDGAKASFFKGWRLYVLYPWTLILIGITIYLYKKKINLFYMIIASIICSLIVFQPWLAN